MIMMNVKRSILHQLGLSLALAPFISAGFCTKARRLQASQDVLVTGRWDDRDAHNTAVALFKDLTENPETNGWYKRLEHQPDQHPVISFERVKVKAHEHIEPDSFMLALRKQLINTGRLRVVESRSERSEIREERAEQHQHANSDFHKADGQELGADYVLKGTLVSNVQAVEGRRVLHYLVSLRLVEVSNQAVVWEGSHEEKKLWTKRWTPS